MGGGKAKSANRCHPGGGIVSFAQGPIFKYPSLDPIASAEQGKKAKKGGAADKQRTRTCARQLTFITSSAEFD